MDLPKESDIQLRQALLSLMAAAEQLGIHPELLRLTAIGILTKEAPKWWVDTSQVEASIRELNVSVSSLAACSPNGVAKTD